MVFIRKALVCGQCRITVVQLSQIREYEKCGRDQRASCKYIYRAKYLK